MIIMIIIIIIIIIIMMIIIMIIIDIRYSTLISLAKTHIFLFLSHFLYL